MTRFDFLRYCLDTYGTEPDYPFGDYMETAVLRHGGNRKWYALLIRVPKNKFGIKSDEITDVVNLKLPTELFGSFGAADGVYPAYHMSKVHWISVILDMASDDTVAFLTDASYEATKPRMKKKSKA